MTVQMTLLCPKPDNRGRFNPRCEHVIEQPRGEKTPRQCRAAATARSRFCVVHQPSKETA